MSPTRLLTCSASDISLVRSADLETRSVAWNFGSSLAALAKDVSPVKWITKLATRVTGTGMFLATFDRSLTATSRLCAKTLNAKRAIQIPLLDQESPERPPHETRLYFCSSEIGPVSRRPTHRILGLTRPQRGNALSIQNY